MTGLGKGTQRNTLLRRPARYIFFRYMQERFSQDLLQHLKPIDFAVEDPENARLHPEENLGEILRSLEAHGQVEPIVYWTSPDGLRIIKAGNGRHRVANGAGWTRMAMVEFVGSAEEAMAFALAANRAPELARWDVPKRDAQLASLGIVWEPVEVSWEPQAEPFVAPAPIVVEVIPPKEEPKKRERAHRAVETTCRVSQGDLWILGRHRVMCSSQNDARALRLLCLGQRPSLRYMVLAPDAGPRWWSLGECVGLPCWPGWSQVQRALQGEIKNAGWSFEDVVRITHDDQAGRWFSEDAGWEPIHREAYEALAAEGAEKGAFAHPYEALKAAMDRLQEAQDKDFAFLEPLLGHRQALVLGSVLPAALVATERTDGRCFGALAAPEACDRAISFWEQATGLTAEKA